MNQNPKDKKIDLLVIVISAIIIAIIINFLSNYFYEKLHLKASLNWIIGGLAIILALAILLLYSLLFSNVGHNSITIFAPLTFSRKDNKFLDLPFNYLSVQTRVNFNKLPREGQIHLGTYDKSWSTFFDSELNRFLNQSIQTSIVKWILPRWKSENEHETCFIDKKDFPRPINENVYLKDWLKEEGKLYAPFIQTIRSFGPNNAFIEIKTKYGRITFSWRILYSQTPYQSQYFFDKEFTTNDVHDFEILLTLSYKGNFWKIYSKKITKFYDWCTSLEILLHDYDWKTKQVDRVLLVVKELKDDLKK